MALITCKDCGKEFSSSAEKCVHCGCPSETFRVSENKKNTKLFLIKLLVLAVVIIGLIIFVTNGGLQWIGDTFSSWFSGVIFDSVGIDNPS